MAAEARAEPPRAEVAWDPAWPRFSSYELAVTGALAAGMGVLLLQGEAEEPTWSGPILLDDELRDAMRSNSSTTRGRAQVLGDVFYYGGLAYPYLVDVVAVTWIGHDAPDVAAQMALIDSEAFAITGFLSFLANATVRRERPYMSECPKEQAPDVFPRCDDPGPNEGFYSGHTGIAFTGAALTCTHHQYLPLYGPSGVGGTIVCVASMTGAVATGALRLVADQHYASDVIAGGAMGLLSGFLVPRLHYRSPSDVALPRWLPLAWLSSRGAGLAAAGMF